MDTSDLFGNVFVDEAARSSLNLTLCGSTLTGAVQRADLTHEGDSTWIVTEDSSISGLKKEMRPQVF